MTDQPRCGQITKRGSACRRRILPGVDACYQHRASVDDAGHRIDGGCIPGVDAGAARLRWMWDITAARITADLMIRDHCALIKRLEIVARMWDEQYGAPDGESVLDEVSSRLRLITTEMS